MHVDVLVEEAVVELRHLPTSAHVSTRQHTSAHVSTRQHTPAHVSTRQHTSAHVSIHQHTCCVTMARRSRFVSPTSV